MTKSEIIGVLLLPLFLDVGFVPGQYPIPTRLYIPSIGLSERVYPVSLQPVPGYKDAVAYQVLPGNVGWHEDSARVGEGNTVLNGHNFGGGKGVFATLPRVQVGDSVLLNDATFVVTEILVLNEEGEDDKTREENARYILPTEDVRITLVTCLEDKRLIVIAK